MNRDRLRAQLKLHEGIRRELYDDATGKVIRPGSFVVGIPTIGIGHAFNRPLSHEAIQFLLEEDIDDHWRDLTRMLPWVLELSEVRQRVLLDMTFNLGVTRLIGFMFTLRAIRDGRWDDAADGMLKSLWATQVGKRARRLAAMMETGLDSEDF